MDADRINPRTAPHRKRRCFLFLQGHPSAFWPQLADALEAAGHEVRRVHLCLADWIFWGRRPGRHFRGRFSRWERWLETFIAAEGVTDIFYYADRLPYHVTALSVARRHDVACWAIEFGYLRPDWLTIEADGMGAASRFPRLPDEISALAAHQPVPDMRPLYPHRFAQEAFGEVSYHLLQAYGRPFYPFYVSDKIYWPAIDYLSWLPQLALSGHHERKARAVCAQAQGLDYTLVAMQIEADYQIRASSPYGSLIEFLDEVITSFARHAPASRQLIIKLHPLDNGLERWFSRIRRLARQAGVGARVQVIKGGDLMELLRSARGCVLVNSTVGLHAMRLGVPTCVRGHAIFDVPGLSHQSGLDGFWTAPEPVDPELFAKFERALTQIQVKGSFYDPAGRAAAIGAIVARFAD